MKQLLMSVLVFQFMLCVAFGADDNVFTYKVGEAEISVFVEVKSPGNPSILLNATEEQIKKYIPSGSYESEINAVFVRIGKHNILVDTGFGRNITAGLETLGVTPEQVDTVLLTHMHGDHISGLQKDGEASFANAEVLLSKKEMEYWKDDATVMTALAPYGKKVKTFEPGILGDKLKDLLPGVAPVAAYGHTPGHTIFLVTSGKDKMMIWGDLVHASAIQYALPDVSVTYDTDPRLAAAVRRMVFTWMVDNEAPAAGMHTLYPGMLRLDRTTSGYLPVYTR